MGSRRTPKQYKLIFADGDYEGLEVVMRSVTIREMRQLRGSSSESEQDGFDGLLELVANHIVEWNREDEDGQPLPPTLASLEDEEPSLIHIIIGKWTEAVAGVPAPLEQPSDSGETSAVESIPMEALSGSLAS
ncbi:MAG: hypothetical protein HOV92_18210 [Streptomyces sp.]|nr:hypothetical protein [Streptomyces sp.]